MLSQKQVCIYSAVSGPHENRPLARGWLGWARNRARVAADIVAWRLTGAFNFHYYTYTDRLNSNVGDIAIRQAIKGLVERGLRGRPPFFELQWEELNDETVSYINENCSHFIVGGSGYFQVDSAGQVSYRLPRDLPFLRRLRVPVLLFGVGVNFVRDRDNAIPGCFHSDSVATVQEILQLASAISVRDQLSQSMLQPLTDRSVTITGDPALFLADIEKPGGSAGSSQMSGRAGPTIGLNLGFHGAEAVPIMKENFEEYVRLCRDLIARFNPKLVYFVHADPERIVPRLLRMRGIDVECMEAMPGELLQSYRKLDLHICQMLHSSILAVSVDVPTVNMSYDVKNEGFFELMGIRQYVSPVMPLDREKVLQLCVMALAEAQTLRPKIAKRRAELRSETEQFVEEACRREHSVA